MATAYFSHVVHMLLKNGHANKVKIMVSIMCNEKSFIFRDVVLHRNALKSLHNVLS